MKEISFKGYDHADGVSNAGYYHRQVRQPQNYSNSFSTNEKQRCWPLAALVLQGWLFSAGCTSCPNQGTFFATIIMAHLLVCSIAHLPPVWSVLHLSWTPSWRCAHRSTPSLSCPTLQSNKCRIPTFFFPCQNSAQSWCQMVLASQHGLIEIKDLQ